MAASPATPASGTALAPPAFRRDDAEPGLPVAGLVLLAVLLGVAAWVWLRRWRSGALEATGRSAWPRVLALTTGSTANALRVVASRRLDGSARVHVVECDGRRYLVGCNGQQAITLLGRVDPPDPAPDAGARA